MTKKKEEEMVDDKLNFIIMARLINCDNYTVVLYNSVVGTVIIILIINHEHMRYLT